MASLKCMFCGYGIHHHGEPEGTKPVEHIFCTEINWQKLEKDNLTCDNLEMEYDEIFFYAWKCSRCGSFTFFNDNWRIIGFYAPKENFSAEPMQEPFEFGPFWDDFQWFDITESDITAAEVFTKFPGNLWLAKNEYELRLYEDEARTKCVGQFQRFQSQGKVTVATMTLNAFKKILANWDDIEFVYQNIYYNFMKEPIDGGKFQINVWRGQGYKNSIYSRVIEDGENFVDDLINAKIFPDDKSIIEVQGEIIL